MSEYFTSRSLWNLSLEGVFFLNAGLSLRNLTNPSAASSGEMSARSMFSVSPSNSICSSLTEPSSRAGMAAYSAFSGVASGFASAGVFQHRSENQPVAEGCESRHGNPTQMKFTGPQHGLDDAAARRRVYEPR